MGTAVTLTIWNFVEMGSGGIAGHPTNDLTFLSVAITSLEKVL